MHFSGKCCRQSFRLCFCHLSLGGPIGNRNGGGSPIGGFIGYFKYDAKVFSYSSFKGEGIDASGGAGTVKFLYSAPGGTAPSEVSFTLTLKATAAGNGKFSVETDEFINDENYNSLGTPSKTLSVSAINPTKSANADLSALKPSSGTLTPKFSAKTTEYTITVPYTTTTLNLNATASHKEAKVGISGSNSLQVGKNTRVITVTAANGTTKKYTVVITRSANQATTTKNPNTTTTTTAPEKELQAVELPTGFAWDTATVNNMLVSAAKHEKSGMILLYLIPTDSKDGSFYIYYENEGQFAPFRPFAIRGGQYVLLDMPVGQTAPRGTKRDVFRYEGGEVAAFVYEDAAQADFTIVYAVSPAGVTGLYVHDRTDGSLQRYREVEFPADVPADNPTHPHDGTPGFLATHKDTLLRAAAVCGGLLVVIGIILVAVLLSKRRHKGSKH